MKKKYTIILLFLVTPLLFFSQNTVGVISNSEGSFNGYTLFTTQTETYLINNCGEVINQWVSAYNSGRSAYLLENGNLLRAASIPNPGNIAIPGLGGRVELFDWDGNLIWEYNYSTETVSQHHDIYPMPNGNILLLGASKITNDEAIQLGKDPSHLVTDLYNEHILELEPVGNNSANIIWEWHIKDHLIQDFDNTKANYGVVDENPQRLDINYLGSGNSGNPNWLHCNSVQYNADLDQIILSFRFINEFIIIDHSTTTTEAASTSGGTYLKGGDILYRWGNPASYQQGSTANQKLFGQHYPHWITEGDDAGKIILFNNGWQRSTSFSEIDIIDPPMTAPGFYSYTPNTAYGPSSPDYIYTAPTVTDFYSPILSGAQRLPNGNTLICEGTSGRLFEIDVNENIVWEYINPDTSAGILSQGDSTEFVNNNLFRGKKYAVDYPAFTGRDLTPGDPIELNSNTNAPCEILNILEFPITSVSVFPNPVQSLLNVRSTSTIDKIEFYSILGKKIHETHNTKNSIDISTFKSGLYFVQIHSGNKHVSKKIIKQ